MYQERTFKINAMQKIFFIGCFLFAVNAFAQNIPADSFALYREKADSLFKVEQYSQSIELYKQLVWSGDATAGYELYEIYSQGMGVDADKNEARKWLDQANAIDEQRTSTKNNPENVGDYTLQDLLNECGGQIEHGARLKNVSVALGVVGGISGGVMIITGASNQNNKLCVIGGAVLGGLGLAALIIDVVGNSYIRDGGRTLKNIQFDGNGIKVKF